MSYQLTKKQSREPMMMTWGRIQSVVGIGGHGRLYALLEKFNRDLANAKIEEGYFNDK